MAKLKITTRVRDEDGDLGEIMDKRKGLRLVRYDDPDYGLQWKPKWALTVDDNTAKLSPEICTSEYSVGDRVRNVGERGYGVDFPLNGEGVVTNVDTGVFAKSDATGWVGYFFNNEIEPAEPATTEWTPKVGDRVVFNTTTPAKSAKYYDGEMTVTRFNDVGVTISYPPFAPFTHAARSLTQITDASSLAPAPLPVAEQPAGESGEVVAAWSPKVGDVVNWTRVRGEFDGSTIEAPDNFWDFVLRATNGETTFVYAHELEPATPAPVAVAEATATPAPLKVGDRVVSENNGETKYRITAINGEEADVIVIKTNGSDGITFDGQRLKIFSLDPDFIATPAPAPKFKVGDNIRHIDLNLIGTVKALLPSNRVSTWWPEKQWGGCDHENELELVSAIPAAPPAPALTIGSQVTFTATGRLSAINENGHYQVTFPGLPSGRNSFALPAQYVALAN